MTRREAPLQVSRAARLLALGLWIPLWACADRQQAELPAFEAALAANDSATQVLEDWCRDHRIADPAAIRAERVMGEPLAPPADIRRLLGVSATEPLHYRHVRLVCGTTVLSIAHNWYVPARLTNAMNRTLDMGDTPFGKVVRPLAFTRERLETGRGGDPACPKDTALVHRALLRLPDRRPISLVIECYTAGNFGGR